jgi:hypothetical protein
MLISVPLSQQERSYYYLEPGIVLLYQPCTGTCCCILYSTAYGVWRMAYGVWRMTYYGVWRMACGVQVPTNRHRHRMHVELLVTIYHRHTNRHAASVTTTNNILLFTQQQPPPCCLVRSCAWLVKLRLQEHVPPCEALLWRSFPPKIGCWEKARPKRRLDW